MKFIRLYFNWLLVKLGVRRILPAYFINRVPVRECGEAMAEFDRIPVRQTVVAMLCRVNERLPEGYAIRLMSGWRSQEEQQHLRDTMFALLSANPDLFPESQELTLDQLCAKFSGHSTGGAVDVQLMFQGKIADCGTEYLELSPLTATHAAGLSPEQHRNRQILYSAMTDAGFVNYPAEWWHYAYGDKLYCAYSGRKCAVYGEITNSNQVMK